MKPATPAVTHETAEIDLDRLRTDLEALAKIGGNLEHGGVDRPSFSDADMDARRWLMGRMAEGGLMPHMDAAGNVIGRWGAGDGPAVMIGSHLDSVPRGGVLDGTLGVIAGLECVRTMMSFGFTPTCPIEVVATSEEEGRFGGMLGSQALTGQVDADWLYAAKDDTGIALVDCMRAQGLSPEDTLRLGRPTDSIRAFLELHIEQGPVLDRKQIPVGIVEGISGVFHWSVTLKGQANHAGTTPMEMRNDAFLALADFAHTIPDIIDKAGGGHSRLTIGKVTMEPGFAHTVPGLVEFSLVGKDLDNAVMERLRVACRSGVETAGNAHGVASSIEEISWLRSQPCHPDIIAAFHRAAGQLGIETMVMPSGAGHDTQVMAAHTRAGMIFVPSVGGISHAPQERTDWNDIALGANVLLHTAMNLTSAPCRG